MDGEEEGCDQHCKELIPEYVSREVSFLARV